MDFNLQVFCKVCDIGRFSIKVEFAYFLLINNSKFNAQKLVFYDAFIGDVSDDTCHVRGSSVTSERALHSVYNS